MENPRFSLRYLKTFLIGQALLKSERSRCTVGRTEALRTERWDESGLTELLDVTDIRSSSRPISGASLLPRVSSLSTRSLRWASRRVRATMDRTICCLPSSRALRLLNWYTLQKQTENKLTNQQRELWEIWMLLILNDLIRYRLSNSISPNKIHFFSTKAFNSGYFLGVVFLSFPLHIM